MPEGHTIHRLSRDLSRAFGRRPVAASTLQDRFEASAALLDGATMTRTRVQPHLLLRFPVAGGYGDYASDPVLDLGLTVPLR